MSISVLRCLSYRKFSALPKPTLVPIQGVIFDMDGTLTIPSLNIDELRETLGISKEIDILKYANSAPSDKKEKIYQIIDAFQKEGAKTLTLQPTVHKLFQFLHDNDIQTGLLTRNNRESVDVFIDRFIQKDANRSYKSENDIFSKVLTRDFKPVKPDPAAAHHICSFWNLNEENVVLVGDSIYDIRCGNNAGCVTMLMHKNGNDPEWQKEADHSINNLEELLDLFQKPFDVKRY